MTHAAHRAAFDAAYSAHFAAVHRRCLRFCAGDVARAEDLCHEVFLELWERLPDLADHDALGGWLMRVTVNRALSSLRRRRMMVSRLELFFRGRRRSEERTPEREDAISEKTRATLEALAGLPEKERIALSLKVLEERPQTEIARVMGHSEGYVSKLLTRGQARLLEALRAASEAAALEEEGES